jgi:transcriptional regulator with XRE-family HTH domain
VSSQVRSFTRYNQAALKLLGKEIELNRKLKKITAAALAERCGISRPTLRRVERGEPSVEIGIVFEVASIVGVKLFNSDDPRDLKKEFGHVKDKVALLPESVRTKKRKEPNDAF